MHTRVVVIGILILVITCCFVIHDGFDSQNPMPLADWVYSTTIAKYPKDAKSFVQVEN
jgi:hypothetical protein